MGKKIRVQPNKMLCTTFPNITWSTLYMQAFSPLENTANTVGNGLIFSSCISNENKNILKKAWDNKPNFNKDFFFPQTSVKMWPTVQVEKNEDKNT